MTLPRAWFRLTPAACGRYLVSVTIKTGMKYLLGLLLALTLTACATSYTPQLATDQDSAAPSGKETHFKWKTSTPEAQGVDSHDLTRVLERVVQQEINLHGLIVYRNGHIILEVYPPPYDAQTVHNIKSVSKSLLSALVGIAIDKGIVSGIDQRVSEFFPEYFKAGEHSGKHDISLRHLLTMTSGLDLDESGPSKKAVFSSDDWIGAALQHPLVALPGLRFAYSTALTHLMSGLLSRASGSSLLTFCQRYLCGPLGFVGMQWRTGPSGYYFGGAELYLRPRDMLKLGLLYLNEGRWQGQQLVPSSWVHASTQDQLGHIASEQQYGFWWWPVDDGYMAIGWGGQRLLVIPRKNLVIAATFADPDGFDRMFEDFDTSKLTSAPLAPNPSAASSLHTAIHTLQNPSPHPAPPLPPMAHAISGKTFTVSSEGQTPMIKHISFDFSRAGDYSLSIDWGKTSRRLALGLDGRFRVTPTGKLGRLPHGNQLALRGQWLDNNTLTVELVPIGEPLHTDLTLTFYSEHVVIKGHVRPTGRELSLLGTLSNQRIADPATRPGDT